MACIITYKGVQYTEAEFLAFLANGEYERMVAEGLYVPPVTGEASDKKLRKHYQTIMANTTVAKPYQDFLEENKFGYKEFPNEETLKQAQEYIKEHGFDAAYDEIVSGGTKRGSVSVGVGYLLFSGLHSEFVKAVKAGDNAVADALAHKMEAVSIGLAEKGTVAGQEVQAFSLFSRVFEDPVSTEFYLRRKIKQGNDAAKSDTEINKNAKNKAKKITQKAKKYAKEWAETVEKDLGAKPVKTKLSDLIKPTEETKKDYSAWKKRFGGMQLNDITTIAALAVDPEFRKGVKAVLKMTAYDATKFAEEMISAFGEGAKKHLTELYKIAKDELDKEFNAKREVEKLEKKILAKQKQVASQLIEKVKSPEPTNGIWGRYKKSAVNSIIQMGAKRLAGVAAETPPLQDFINQLTKNVKGFIKEGEQKNFPSMQDPAAVLIHIVKNEEKYAELLKETREAIQEKYKDDPEMLIQLDAFFGQLFSEPFSPKTLEAVVKGQMNVLGKSIASIAKSYYTEIVETGKQVSDTLQERLMAKFGLDEAAAKEIADKVEKRYKEMVSDRIAKDLKADIDRQIKKDNREGIKSQPVDMLDRLVSAALLGKLDANMLMDIFKYKYSQASFTKEDSEYVFKQVERIAAAKDQWRKAEETARLINYMAGKNPVYFADAMNHLWYASVLSSALLPIGTGETNIGFNIIQVGTSAMELTEVATIQAIREGLNGERTAKEVKQIISDYTSMILRSAVQALTQTKRLDNKVADLLLKRMMSESGTNFIYTLMYGSDSFTNFERPLEQTIQTEHDFKSMVSKAKAGDKMAIALLKNTIYAFMSAANSTKYVGRMLAAQDMFFQGVIKNMWLQPVAREYFYKKGLRGKELTDAVKENLYNTQIEVENAQQEAVDDIIEFDFNVEEEDDKYEVYRLGKKEKTFDTRAEANSYIATEATKGLRYKRAVMEKLNAKMASEVIQRAGKIAQNYTGTNVPTGGTGYAYRAIINVKGKIDNLAQIANQHKRSSDNVAHKAIYEALAQSVKSLNLIVPFVKVMINIAKLISDSSPLGGLRAYRGGDIFHTHTDEGRTQTEKDIIWARFATGMTIIAFNYIIPYLLSAFDDDDEEKRKKKTDKETLALYEKITGEKANIDNPIFTLPKKGDICGSLDFLPKSKADFLIETGLAKPNCYYDGEKWVTLLNKPSKFWLIGVGTIDYYYRYVIQDPKNADKPVEEQGNMLTQLLEPIFATMDAFLDISAMKGLSNVSYKKSPEERLQSFLELPLSPYRNAGNPAIIRTTAQYFDGRVRHMIKPKEDLSGYLQQYVPGWGTFATLKYAPIKHGMFGQELHRLPAETQGMWTPKIAYERYKNESKELFQMGAWLSLNGYYKKRDFPVKEYFDADGVLHKISTKQKEEIQNVSGKMIMKQINANKENLQKIANQSNDYFVKMVDRIVDVCQELAFAKWIKENHFKEKATVKTRTEKRLDEKLNKISDKILKKIK